MSDVAKQPLLVGQTIIYGNDGASKVTGGVVLDRQAEGYRLQFVPLNEPHKYINGIIDKTGVHIDYVSDNKIPTYNYNKVSEEFIPVDNNYMVVGYNNLTYFVLCGTTIAYIEKPDNIQDENENKQLDSKVLIEYQKYHIDCDNMRYIYQHIVNFDVLKHSPEETGVCKLTMYDDDNLILSYLVDGFELPLFNDDDIMLLPHILQRANKMGYDYRFEYYDSNINYYGFEYKYCADHVVLYMIDMYDTEFFTADIDLTMFDKTVVLCVEGYDGCRETINIQLKNASIYQIDNYKYFNIKADKIALVTDKVSTSTIVNNTMVLNITAKDIDSRLLDIDSYCNEVIKVNIIAVNE